MSEVSIKLEKEKIYLSNAPELEYVGRFSRPFSLFEALSIGILEILIRFKKNTNYLIPFKEKIIRGIEEAKRFTEENGYFEIPIFNLDQIIDTIDLAPDAITGFSWLDNYSKCKVRDSSCGLNLGMKFFICAMLPDQLTLIDKLITDKQLSEEEIKKIFENFAYCTGVQISVYSAQCSEIMIFRGDQNFDCPNMFLLNDQNNFGNLYSDGMVDMENNSHFDYKLVLDYPFYGRNKLSESNIIMTELRSKIKNSISIIESQKKKILNEAMRITCKVGFMVKSSIKQLDKMIEEYNEIYRKTELESKYFQKIRYIINENLVFEYPCFSKIEGVLTKKRELPL